MSKSRWLLLVLLLTSSVAWADSVCPAWNDVAFNETFAGCGAYIVALPNQTFTIIPGTGAYEEDDEVFGFINLSGHWINAIYIYATAAQADFGPMWYGDGDGPCTLSEGEGDACINYSSDDVCNCVGGPLSTRDFFGAGVALYLPPGGTSYFSMEGTTDYIKAISYTPEPASVVTLATGLMLLMVGFRRHRPPGWAGRRSPSRNIQNGS